MTTAIEARQARARRRRLQLTQEDSGPRHELDGRPVRDGDTLELRLHQGLWVAGRYEWAFVPERRPLLYLQLGGEWELELLLTRQELRLVPVSAGPKVSLELPEDAELRWPPLHPSSKGLTWHYDGSAERMRDRLTAQVPSVGQGGECHCGHTGEDHHWTPRRSQFACIRCDCKEYRYPRQGAQR